MRVETVDKMPVGLRLGIKIIRVVGETKSVHVTEACTGQGILLINLGTEETLSIDGMRNA